MLKKGTQSLLVMGRIKTVLIKRITKKIFREYAERFTNDYEKNKQVVAALLPETSKKIRNMVAGYATRLAKTRGKTA